MSRRTETMEPVEIKGLQQLLRGLAEVRPYTDAEEPILAPPTRAAVYSWMLEINARDELAAVGIKPRATAMLSGPPGTGKTTLAHHLAARLKVPLVLVGAENIITSALGGSEQNVARLFAALENRACVVLIDEIDAIGMKRSAGMGEQAAGQAMISTLTVMLRKIEEFSGLLLAATNRPDAIDPALWRRFHLQITVDLPGIDERFAICKRYAMPFEPDDDLIDALATLTAGASPALLRGLMEGLKRALVLGKRLRMPIDDVAALIALTLASLKPPPEIEPPALWMMSETEIKAAMRDLPWPPTRATAERHPS